MQNFNNVIIGQKAFIINDKHEILIMKRDKELIHVNKWDVPGGKVDGGESLYEALQREIKEEVGLDLKKIILTLSSSKFTGSLDGAPTIVRNIYLCQASGTIILSEEHSEFKWVRVEELSDYEFAGEDDLKLILQELPEILSQLNLNISYSKLL